MAALIKYSLVPHYFLKTSTYTLALLAVLFLILTIQCRGQQSDTVHYEYDRLNRVTKVTYDSSGASIIYTYDAAGNRTATTIQGTNLAPVLTSLNPSNVPAGTHGFTLGINGNNLINGASVLWNGSNRAAIYFGSYVTIDLTDADLASPGNFSVAVVNPSPNGAQSNQLTFTVGPSNGTLQINTITPKVGRTSGGQAITLTGAFPNLSTVMVGGINATWSYTNGSNDTSTITITTPAHIVGAVTIDLTPTTGTPLSKQNAFAYLPTTFTDNTLMTGVTTAKAQHIVELRQAVDALRAVAGLQPAPWTDATLNPSGTIIKAIHIQELRTFLDDAASRLGYPTSPYTDPSPLATGAGGVSVKRIHIEELRQRIRNIAG